MHVFELHQSYCFNFFATFSTVKGTALKSLHPTSGSPQSFRIDDLCTMYGLSSEDIDKDVSDNDILEIYRQLEKWEEVANHLGLTPADIEVINAEHDVQLKRLHMLQTWKSKGIATGTAVSYRVLIQTLLKCECSSSAVSVCKLITNVVKHKP